MKNAVIITEYNPFHNGHALQIKKLCAAGAETVTIIMSGDFCQRGLPATFSKFSRAKSALVCGADLVIELPLPWSVSSAEKFAEGAVSIAASLGCIDTICFGGETDDCGLLEKIATLFCEPSFDSSIKEALSSGESYPSVRSRLASQQIHGAAEILAEPNNILAIEYIKAIVKQKCDIKPFVIKRVGAEHHSNTLSEGIASGSFIRDSITSGDEDLLASAVPFEAYKLYQAEIKDGFILDEKAFSLSLLTALRLLPHENFSALASAGGEGLSELMFRCVSSSSTADELYNKVKSKRFTHARIRRLALEGYLGITKALPVLPPYIRVLGSTDSGLNILSQAKVTATLPIIFSLKSPACENEQCRLIAELTAKSAGLYGLCLKTPTTAAREFTEKFIKV